MIYLGACLYNFIFTTYNYLHLLKLPIPSKKPVFLSSTFFQKILSKYVHVFYSMYIVHKYLFLISVQNIWLNFITEKFK